MSACLAVMAKQPERGKVKTRIAAMLGDDQAAEVCRCALDDTLALAASIADVARVLSYAPPTGDSQRYFKQAAPDFVLIPLRQRAASGRGRPRVNPKPTTAKRRARGE